MKKLIVLFLSLSVLVGCLLLGSCGEKETITVNEVTHSIFYAPFYAAINLGYFTENGIDIDLVNGGGSDKSMTALITGQAEIGLMGPETAVYTANEGRDDHAVIVAQLTKRDGSFLLGKNPDPDFNWSKLEGSSIIGGRKGGMPQMTLESVLRSHGLIHAENINMRTDVSFDLMGGAFMGGSDDYVTLFEPSASAMEAAGEGYIVASVGEAGGDVPYTCFMVTGSYLEENRETVTAFVDALYRGQRFVRDSTAADVADALTPSFPDSDAALIATVVQRYKDIDAWKTDPKMTEESYGRLIDLITGAGIINKAPAFDDLIDNSIAEELTG